MGEITCWGTSWKLCGRRSQHASPWCFPSDPDTPPDASLWGQKTHNPHPVLSLHFLKPLKKKKMVESQRSQISLCRMPASNWEKRIFHKRTDPSNRAALYAALQYTVFVTLFYRSSISRTEYRPATTPATGRVWRRFEWKRRPAWEKVNTKEFEETCLCWE